MTSPADVLVQCDKFQWLKARPLSFSLSAGEVGVIGGANGIGKTTLLRAIAGQRVRHRGELKLSPALRHILYRPQLTAPQFALPLLLSDILDWYKGPGLSDAPAIGRRLVQGLDLSRSWDSASGGERQRALLYTALSQPTNGQTALLLLDEPMNHVDAATAGAIGEAISEWILYDAAHRAALVVSHDSRQLQALSKASTKFLSLTEQLEADL